MGGKSAVLVYVFGSFEHPGVEEEAGVAPH